MGVAAPVLSHRDFLRIDKSYEEAASVVSLRYVNDRDEGIKRIKKGKTFTYTFKGKQVNDERTLERIHKLVIPPAWENVWISPAANGHIQVTGLDVRGRKQYKYHPRWTVLQQETKFHRMIEFGKALPDLRKKLQRDLARPGFPESKVLAMVISIMERTFIRIGNEGYEKLYGSYGLTTMKNSHVNIRGDQVTFSFRGKKGVKHNVTMKSKRFARIIRQCKAIPGKELFQYYDENGELQKVDSGQVNEYLKTCVEMDFTTKDFRTWAGTLSMLSALVCCEPCTAKSQIQKNIVASFRAVSAKLGNTVAVCKKYYVHPEIVRLYRDDKLSSYLDKKDISDTEAGLTKVEEALLKILDVVRKSKVVLKDEPVLIPA